MNKPHISIPTPCHENWDAMHPREKGRHCDACDKTVIDFTGKTDDEIREYFLAHRHERICGHFRTDQVHTAPSRIHAFLLNLHATASQNIKRHVLRAVALFFIGLMMTMTGCEPKKTEHQQQSTFGISDTNDFTIEGEAQYDYTKLKTEKIAP